MSQFPEKHWCIIPLKPFPKGRILLCMTCSSMQSAVAAALVEANTKFCTPHIPTVTQNNKLAPCLSAQVFSDLFPYVLHLF